MARPRFYLAHVLILFLYLASFARTREFEFVWDDVAEIAENPILRGDFWAGLKATQHEHMQKQYADWLVPTHDSYRPLRYVSYRVDGALSDFSPAAMHLHNVLLGLFVLCAALWFLREWGLSPALTCVGVGLLALHPLSVEAVAYVSARSDLLAAGFALTSAAAALRSTRTGSKGLGLLAVASFVLSLSSKEAYIAMPVALLAWAHHEGRLRPMALRVLGFVVAGAGFWFVRGLFAKAAGGGRAADALASLGPVFAQYVRMIFAPFDCSIARPAAAPSWPITLLVLAVYAALFVVALRRPEGRGARLFAGALWFATLLGPSVVAATVMGVASDRYAYLALLAVPLCLHALSPIAELGVRRELALGMAAVAALWAAACVYVSFEQVTTWRTPRALYEHAVNMAPSSAAAWYGLGHALAQEGGCDAAEALFEKALTLDPRHARALNNAGVCRLRRGAFAEAEQAFQGALAATRNVYPQAWANLARALLAQGRRGESCRALDAALAIDPSYRAAREERAQACPSPAAR